MKAELKLWHQGAILIALPLAFEIVFVLVLMAFLALCNSQIEKSVHAKEIIVASQQIIDSFIQGAKGIGAYAVEENVHQLQIYKERRKVVERKLLQLESLMQRRKDDRQSFKNLNAICWDILDTLDRAEKGLHSGDKNRAIDEFKTTGHKIGQLRDELHPIVTYYAQADLEGEVTQSQMRNVMKAALLVGLIANVSLAVGAAGFFHRSITRRLDILMENIWRFLKEEPLAEPVTGADEVAELDKVLHTMTEHIREANEKIKLSQTRFATIIENMPLGIVTIGDQNRIASINPSAEAIFARSSDELVGKEIASVLHLSKPGREKLPLPALLSEHAGRPMEMVAERPGGQECYVEVSLKELVVPSGQTLMASLQDISERHEIEMLKRDFVAMVSHDLRTPLTSIKLTLEMLSEGLYGDLTGEGQERIGRDEKNCQRLIGMINDLLDMEKLEAGRFDLVLAPTDLDGVFEQARDALVGFAESHDVTIASLPCNLRAQADGDRVVQVLVNLIGNAVKFSPAGSTITLSASAADNVIKVCCTDQGRGIPADRQAAIFERFKQVQKEDASEKGGAGLGLAICKAIVESHGGDIGVESQPGHGSTFWFTLPPAELN